MANLTIIIGKTVDEKLYFRIRNEYGRILLTSREYQHFDKCINEIYGIQTYSDFEFEVERSDNGYQYALIGSWGRMVAESPCYTFIVDMKSDMLAIKSSIALADVIDNSSSVRFFRKVRI